jgi:hypothetical protein
LPRADVSAVKMIERQRVINRCPLKQDGTGRSKPEPVEIVNEIVTVSSIACRTGEWIATRRDIHVDASL